ncbi:MAG TPA: response regulator transcription factor [Alphaproteobacteria bacterium]|nr:response regulator transcription factor [Alphaproteobacteria bacterium]
MRLLLAEDNHQLADFLKASLGEAGFAVDIAETAAGARSALSGSHYDVLVVDLGLPDADGITIIESLRARGDATPAMILTARDGLRDRVDGLNSGADDYLAKPFATEELVARLRALLRRPGSALGQELSASNLTLDTRTGEVQVDGTSVSLSRREIGLLELLLRRAGRVVPKQAIESSLYGMDEEVASNTVEVLVHRLRKRLAHLGAKVNVVTLRGIGYVLTDQTD